MTLATDDRIALSDLVSRYALYADHCDDGRTSDLVWHCRYTDAYRLDAGTWRIARREQRIDAIETRPVHRHRPHPLR
ncbi:hypothetical protein [Actinomadura opuntiae]|uniref:hypothetical protein n=1 Tax=Actinomadura sp. OS1-43 TaxID=604315 RepID=UPI00255B0218|nr:hypothetical protein [Actinomadura sp. OS1-43]MDL4819716.1 hypothetical protein [Actinomadura sp. OS1-43]